MIRKIADNIYSPLGCTTEENYVAVKQGRSMLQSYPAGTMDLQEPFTASLFDWDAMELIPGYTRFETIVIRSMSRALEQTSVDVHSERLLFVLSSTKGNVELLDSRALQHTDERIGLGAAARAVADYFGFRRTPLVVSNACISGLSAQVTAMRLLLSGAYDTAIVCGADVQSRFIISGFASFKALSPQECRPFDIERIGLNLGEAAATIIYANVQWSIANEEKSTACGQRPEASGKEWYAISGAVRNDAFHISGPSPKGEGCYRAIHAAMGNRLAADMAFVNVHGTSTMYNDEMESAAIDRAGLLNVPVNSLKGYYGHTMGAAGVLETILSMRAVEDGCVLATRGYEELGVSHHVKVSGHHAPTNKSSFLKLLSGFGGCNAAMLFSRLPNSKEAPLKPSVLTAEATVVITPDGVAVNGHALPCQAHGAALLTEVYRSHVNNYPKFFKMDELSRLGWLAAELLLQAVGDRHSDSEDRAVIFFGSSSSVCSDRKYQQTIDRADDFFPSPAVFVYTLPNIVTGEIAIRNGYHGETAFYLLNTYDEQLIRQTLEAAMLDVATTSALCGWVDCQAEDSFEARLTLYVKH